MAKNDLSRTQFFQQPKSFDILLSVFKYYLDLDREVNFFQTFRIWALRIVFPSAEDKRWI